MNSDIDSAQSESVPQRQRVARIAILGVGLVCVLMIWVFREPLRNRVVETATLANESPTPDVVEEMIRQAADPRAAILAAWNSAKIVHREVAIRQLHHVVLRGQPMPPELEAMLLAAALDSDTNVRESAFSTLRSRGHPALTALAAAQLHDPDPEIRLLGLNYLKSAPAKFGVPTVMSLLDDSDIRIVATGLKWIEGWSGERFGVKLADSVQIENEQTGLKEFREEGLAKTRAGAERAQAWWEKHRDEFGLVQLEVPPEAYSARQPVPAGDFQLRTLDGHKVRLSDFRGKIVLVNFWTTWCTACVSEMPELIALQKKHTDKLVILGVSLDYVPDSHGHIGGHAAVEDQKHSDGDHDDHEAAAAALKRVRGEIARTVKARGINYTILLDEKNEVGGRFNGGELPTTVIVDAQGWVRRRFIGARSLPVFEAMIAEASQPLRSMPSRPR
ncbi:MAG: TlpA family protein disulfide reductase [Verrucomicrobia subdivision 3 bacterium]|nr:TlpA family protein disulfide reductase [Limisphaerales bacterium]